MIKAIALLRRKPGLSHDDFVAYYETRHAPLIRSLLPGMLEYRRNFIRHGTAFGVPPNTIDFDCITEFWFADQAAYDSFMARAAEPPIARAIAEDEAHVFDRMATRMFVVETRG